MEFKLIKTCNGKDAIIINKFIYNQFRINKYDTYFKCRETKCHASCILINNTISKLKATHNQQPLSELDVNIKISLSELKETVKTNPNEPVLKFYEQKEIQLTEQYQDNRTELFEVWPIFESMDSALYRIKAKLVPAQPASLETLIIPPQYTVTIVEKSSFLLSKASDYTKLLVFASKHNLLIKTNFFFLFP